MGVEDLYSDLLLFCKTSLGLNLQTESDTATYSTDWWLDYTVENLAFLNPFGLIPHLGQATNFSWKP